LIFATPILSEVTAFQTGRGGMMATGKAAYGLPQIRISTRPGKEIDLWIGVAQLPESRGRASTR
jgi:hypothetical protein